MAQPRPRMQTPQAEQRTLQNEPSPNPEISVTVHREAMEVFKGLDKEYIQAMFGSVLFEQFCLKQMELSRKAQDSLPMGRYSPEQFYQLTRDFRLLWRVWNDLLEFSREFKPQQ